MAYKSRVSDAVVRRLPMYYRHLRELEKAGVVRISSQELGERMNLTASQIRQDINCFGGFGQQGYGYRVNSLLHELSQILGLTHVYNIVIVGADRVTRRGDAANKIGTYLKALAAHDNGVPFYVALPSSTFDFSLDDGVAEIPIEERGATEVRIMSGKTPDGSVLDVQICPDETPARNWAFDVTPNRLITGLISERGVCQATQEGIDSLYPESAGTA